jgi:uncharacterized protein (TIGR02300 family)
MSTKAERGTKRTCQNPDCGARFYDLNRAPVTCPVCSSVYQLAVSPMAASGRRAGGGRGEAPAQAGEEAGLRRRERQTRGCPEAEGDEALAVVEGEEEPAAADEDETFLEEEEEDGPDMTGIIGGPVAEPDEPQ